MPANSPSETPSASKHDLISLPQTVLEKEGSHPMVKVNKSELKSRSPPNNRNSSRPMDSSGTSHQKVNSRLGSVANSEQRERLASEPVPRTSVQVPRGVSFILNGEVPLGDTDKDKQDGSSIQIIDVVGAGCKGSLKVPGAISELNGMSEGVAPTKPRGINFLSFGQPPSDDSSSKILSNLLSTCNDGTCKSVVDDMGDGRLTCSSVQGAGTFNFNKRMNQSALNLVSDMKGTKTPPTVPQNVNLLSFNRAHLDASNLKEKANLESSKRGTGNLVVKERQGISELRDIPGTPSPSSPRQSANGFKTLLLSKAVQSTLAFAAQFEANVEVGLPHHQLMSYKC